MAVLAGCDYAPSPKNIGIIKAHKLVRKYRKPSKVLDAVLAGCDNDALPKNYSMHFIRALLTFQHQRIFNLDSNKLEMLYEPNLADWSWMTLRPNISADDIPRLKEGETDFLGAEIEPEMAVKIATGVAHPVLKVQWEGIEELGGEQSFLASVCDPTTVFSPTSVETPRLNLNFDNEEDTVQLSGGKKTVREILQEKTSKKKSERERESERGR